jgi:hypothetical protein
LTRHLTTYNIGTRPINVHSPKLLLIVLWTLAQGFLLIKNGIVTSGEAEKYIREAHLFLQTGKLSSSNFWLYFTQILLLSVCLKFRLGFAGAVAIQLLCNLAATLSFYDLISRWFEKQGTALLAGVLLLLNQPYQEFNTFLQTESLFYSLTLIYSCYLLRIKRLTAKNLLIISFMSTLLIFTRPTGILFLPATFIFLFFISLEKISFTQKIGILAGLAILFLYLLNMALGSGGELDFMLPFRDERIICGVPTLPGFIPIKTASNGNSVYGLLYYLTHNFPQFLRLAGLRTIAFFGLYRNYFGVFHNAFLMFYFYSLYIMALGSIFFWSKTRPYAFMYFISLILLTWLSVILSCDDWHNRFFLSVSPYIIVLALGFTIGRSKKEA